VHVRDVVRRNTKTQILVPKSERAVIGKSVLAKQDDGGPRRGLETGGRQPSSGVAKVLPTGLGKPMVHGSRLAKPLDTGQLPDP
jgi:hypothetical protein